MVRGVVPPFSGWPAALLLVALVPGCGAPSDDALSRHADDVMVVGRVVENTTACVVDAVCLLRLRFADTTVTAIYGTGERPAPPCAISREASDAAFRIEAGDLVKVVTYQCPGEGRYLRRLEPVTE